MTDNSSSVLGSPTVTELSPSTQDFDEKSAEGVVKNHTSLFSNENDVEKEVRMLFCV